MKRRTTMLIAVLTLGVAMTIIAFLPPLPVILVLCAVVGFVYGPIAPIYNYVMQTRAPAAPARPGGRRDGLAGLRRRPARAGRRRARWPTPPGCTTTFLALSVPMLLLGLVAMLLPSLRDLDRDPDPAAAGELACLTTVGGFDVRRVRRVTRDANVTTHNRGSRVPASS